MSAVSIENLTCYYDPSKPALHNLSLDTSTEGISSIAYRGKWCREIYPTSCFVDDTLRHEGNHYVLRNGSEAHHNHFNLAPGSRLVFQLMITRIVSKNQTELIISLEMCTPPNTIFLQQGERNGCHTRI